MANYSREKSKFGGCTGSIIIHSTPGVGINNDPTSAVFRQNLPAGYLKCDGSVLSASDYYALSQVIGVGQSCRFKKERTTLRDADGSDLGQIQLPDLGSKVILGGRSTGVYRNDIVDTQDTTATPVSKVGPQIDVISNQGDQISASYIGNMEILSSGDLDFLGNPKYVLDGSTSETELAIQNFQGHAHRSSQTYLNYNGNHEVGGEGGKDFGRRSGNSGSGNSFAVTNTGGSESVHKHGIQKPTSYAHDFTYSHSVTPVDMSGVTANLDIELSNEDKLDQLVTPFMLVEYLIKF